MERKLSLVTGTSSGLGQAIASALLNRHWIVIGLSRRQKAYPSADYKHYQVDLSRLDEVSAFLNGPCDELLSHSFDRVALVNNAGQLGPVNPITDLAAQDL